MPFIVLTIILFSTIEVAVKLLHGSVDPMLIAIIRFSVSGLLLALSSLHKFKMISLKEYCFIGAIGAIGVSGTFGPYHLALAIPTIDAKDAALIFSLNPLFAAISAVFILHEKFSLRFLFGIILGFLGVYLVIFGWNVFELHSLKGPLFLLSSAVTFGLYTALSKKYVARYGARPVTAITFIVGALFLLPFVNVWAMPNDIYTISIILYLTIFTTYIGYVSFFHGLKKVPVSAGSSLFYFKPLIATLLAVLILKESLTPTFFLGMILIFGAMTLTLFRGKLNETH